MRSRVELTPPTRHCAMPSISSPRSFTAHKRRRHPLESAIVPVDSSLARYAHAHVASEPTREG